MLVIVRSMRAISVAQPWAECIVAHGKNVENRSWKPKDRGYFAVHASQARSLSRFRDCEDRNGVSIDPDEVAYGAIVGFARLTDVITRRQLTPRTRRWFEGEYGLVLEDVIRLRKPVKAKGSLGPWRVKPGVLRKCLVQLSAAERSRVLRGPTYAEPGTACWIVKGRVDRNGPEFIWAGGKARWQTRKPPKDWSPGDKLLFWKGAPHSCVIGVGELGRIEERDRQGNTCFHVRYLTDELPKPLTITKLRADAVLGSAAFLKSGPSGTLFALTDRQAHRIAKLALASNHSLVSARQRAVYTRLARSRS